MRERIRKRQTRIRTLSGLLLLLLRQSAAVRRVVAALGYMTALTCLLIEDVASSLSDIGRGVHYGAGQQSCFGEDGEAKPTVKGYGEVAAPVADPVDAKFICHVCHRILLMCSLRHHFHRLFFLALGEGISNLSQVALEDLHEAMGVAVVVDGTALARRPDKHKLCLH